MFLELTRLSDNGVQTTGKLVVLDNSHLPIMQFDTLELPWKDNVQRKSSIPIGYYHVKKHFSIKFGQCVSVSNVYGRDGILIHSGNFNFDTLGCILVGRGFRDINSDFQVDILNSKQSMKTLLSLMPTNSVLKIIDKTGRYE